MAKLILEYLIINVIFVATVFSAPSNLGQSVSTLYIEENCGKVVPVDTYISLAKRASLSDRPRSKCKVTLSSSSKDRLFIVFENADMAPKTGSQCVTERVDVYDGTSVSNTTLLSDPSGLCGQFTVSYNSTGSNLTVAYTSHTNTTFGFSSVLTPFRSSDTCGPKEFQCYTGNSCIDANFRCDGHPNCADKSDEMDCSTQEPTIGPLMTTNDDVTTTPELTSVPMTTEGPVTTMNPSVMPYIDNATAVSEATTVNTTMVTMVTENVTDVTMTIPSNSSVTVTMVTENVTDVTMTMPSNSSLPHTTPEAPVTTAAPSPQGSDTGAIVGGIIGGIVFIALVAGVLYYFRKKRLSGSGETAPLNN